MLKKRERNVYRIDSLDRIVYVGKAWDEFALFNDAPELAATHVIGRNLWDFVSDEMTRHLYREMLAIVRTGGPMQFDFRCDSPDRRRFLKMNISMVSIGVVQFETITVHTEERTAQDFFRRSPTFKDALVITCSWCKKIRTGENVWHEVEQAIEILQLFNLSPAPQLSHGMCDVCYQEMSQKLHPSPPQNDLNNAAAYTDR